MPESALLKAVKHQKTAMDDPETSTWDAGAAKKRVQKWASSDGSGDMETMDWEKYRRAFTWYDPEDEESLGAYKLPHHDIMDGELTARWKGVAAAMGAMMGARGGMEMPAEDKKKCYAHLAKHYEEFGKEPPEMTMRASDEAQGRVILLSDTPLRLQEGDDGKCRSCVQLMKGGDFVHPDFNDGLHFNRDLFDKLADAFDKQVVGREVLVDADHFSSMFSGSSEAYGWVEKIEARGKGKQGASLWTTVRWTPLGKQAIEDELYKYTSVEMAFDYDDEYGEKHGPAVVAMALTNRPFLRGMRAVTLNAQEYPDYWIHGETDDEVPRFARHAEKYMSIFDRLIEKLKAAFRETGAEPTDDELVERLFAHFRAEAIGHNSTTDTGTGDGANEPDSGRMRAVISRALDLLLSEQKETAAPALTITPAAESDVAITVEKEATMPDETVAAAEAARVTELTAKVTELTTLTTTQASKIDLLTTEVQHLADERDVALAERRLDAARKLGKLSPAMEEAWARDLARKDPEGFERIVASLPVMKELLPETGVIAAANDDNDAAARLADPEKAFDAKAWALVAAEKIGYDVAYTRLKSEDPELYEAYARAKGLGGRRRS